MKVRMVALSILLLVMLAVPAAADAATRLTPGQACRAAQHSLSAGSYYPICESNVRISRTVRRVTLFYYGMDFSSERYRSAIRVRKGRRYIWTRDLWTHALDPSSCEFYPVGGGVECVPWGGS